jgi:hypothetical protein
MIFLCEYVNGKNYEQNRVQKKMDKRGNGQTGSNGQTFSPGCKNESAVLLADMF